MIEIMADGRMYVAPYFMPRTEKDYLLIAKPFELTSYMALNTQRARELWRFTRHRNFSGDLRWRFEGSKSEYGALVEYLLKSVLPDESEE